jgi:hypothetical protein
MTVTYVTNSAHDGTLMGHINLPSSSPILSDNNFLNAKVIIPTYSPSN